MSRQIEFSLERKNDLKELMDHFIVQVEEQEITVTDEFRNELKQNLTAVSHLSNNSDEINMLALVYCLIKVFEPIQEEKLLKYLNLLLPAS